MPIAGADIADPGGFGNDDTIPPELSPLTPRPPADFWSARTALLRTLEGLADQFWPAVHLERLRQKTQTGALDPDRIPAAVDDLQRDPERAALFGARPIPGSALMQTLIHRIE